MSVGTGVAASVAVAVGATIAVGMSVGASCFITRGKKRPNAPYSSLYTPDPDTSNEAIIHSSNTTIVLTVSCCRIIHLLAVNYRLSPLVVNTAIAQLVAPLCDLVPTCVKQGATVTTIVPNRSAAAKTEPPRFGMRFVGIHSYTLPRRSGGPRLTVAYRR